MSRSRVKDAHIRKPAGSPGPLLKTCQTCFHAKIRCDKTQDSGTCDRCLRLKKECVFLPSRKAHTPSRRTPDRTRLDLEHCQEARAAKSSELSTSEYSDSSRPSVATSSVTHTDFGRGNARTSRVPDQGSSVDPYALGLLTFEEGDQLLNTYRTRNTPHFPFVVIPEEIDAASLNAARPCLSLAVLTVTSFMKSTRQRQLGNTLNQLISKGLLRETFLSLDLLQGLLVYVSWAQFQPRPRKDSQLISLASSVVKDLRLDRPKHVTFWSLKDGRQAFDGSDWGPEEKRAVLGCYFLDSSSSVMMQKMHIFHFNRYLEQSCEALSAMPPCPTDRFLVHIVFIQRLTEKINHIVVDANETSDIDLILTESGKITDQLVEFKARLDFHLSECPLLALQLHTLEVFLYQLLLPGFPYGPEHVTRALDSGPQIIGLLSQTVSVAKSLFTSFLSMTPGEDYYLGNVEWIMLNFGLSMGVRLDVLASDSRISSMTVHLRRLLDIQHVIKQIILRLQSCATTDAENDHEPGVFHRFLRHTRDTEQWYQARCAPTPEALLSSGEHSSASVTPQQAPLGLDMAALSDMDFSDFSVTDLFYDGNNVGPWLNFEM